MANLAINTPKGQESLKREAFVIEALKEIFAVDVIKTPRGKANVDGLLSKDGVLAGSFEVKSRGLPRAKLQEFGTGLITYKKIEHGRELSKLLNVPFYVVFITSDNFIFIWQICDRFGRDNFDFNVDRTATKKTINHAKGTAFRLNAYLPVDKAILVFDAESGQEVERV